MAGEKKIRLSVRAKITLWYAAALLTICLLALAFFASVSERAAEAHYIKTLESAAVIMMAHRAPRVSGDEPTCTPRPDTDNSCSPRQRG